MTHHCDYCDNEVPKRHVFCCPSHKVMWHRDNKENKEILATTTAKVKDILPEPISHGAHPYVPFYEKKSKK